MWIFSKQVYTDYLGECKFNTRFNAETIIKFNQQDAETIGIWAASTIQNNENGYMPEPPLVITSIIISKDFVAPYLICMQLRQKSYTAFSFSLEFRKVRMCNGAKISTNFAADKGDRYVMISFS